MKLKGYDTKSYWNSITNTGRFVVVLPDKYVQGLEVSENHLIIDTKEDTDAELENKIANYAQTECQFRYCGTAIPFLTVRSTAR